MIWSLIQQVGGQGASMVAFLILAALLPPGDFGVLGMAGAWLAVLTAFSETGLGAALIQRNDLREDHLSTTFSINLAVGLGLALLGCGLSWAAAAYFRTPTLQPVMTVLSLGFVVRAAGLTQVAIAQRELRFRDLALRDLVASVAGGAVGIAMAMTGYGVWSLVGMNLVNGLIATLMVWNISAWRPRRLAFSSQAARELWPYGSRMLAFNLFKAVVQNTDRIIIGRLFGAHAVGLYALATRVVIYPIATFVGAVGAYLFPKASRLQADPDALRRLYRVSLMAVLNIVVPGLAVLAVLAPELMPVLGARWQEAIPIMQLLTVAAFAQALTGPVGQIMKALGRLGWLIGWSIGLTAVTALALWTGARWGLLGTVMGYVAVHCLTIPTILLIGRHLTGLRLREVLVLVWRPAVASVGLALTLALVSHYLGGLGPAAVLGGAVLVGIIYFVFLGRFNPEVAGLSVRELRKLWPES